MCTALGCLLPTLLLLALQCSVFLQGTIITQMIDGANRLRNTVLQIY